MCVGVGVGVGVGVDVGVGVGVYHLYIAPIARTTSLILWVKWGRQHFHVI